MTPTQAVSKPDPAVTGLQDMVLSSSARSAILALAADVPGGSENVYDDIIKQLVNADTVAELNDPWQAEGLKKYIDRELVVRGIKKVASSFENGLDIFLVIDAYDPRDDHELVVTSGSVAIVAQLIKAYVSDWLPLRVVVRTPKRESVNGRVPLHLEVLGREVHAAS
jgi:hypothetical protein